METFYYLDLYTDETGTDRHLIEQSTWDIKHAQGRTVYITPSKEEATGMVAGLNSAKPYDGALAEALRKHALAGAVEHQDQLAIGLLYA